MKQLLTNYAASITELKRNPAQIINDAGGEPVVILNRNTPTAYLVSPELYEEMLDIIEDIELTRIAKRRLAHKNKVIKVDINDL